MVKITKREMEEIKADILIDLLKHTYVGKRHTSEDNILKGFPKSKQGKIKKVRKILTKEKLVNCKPTSYGPECSINPKKIMEILSLPKIIKASKYDELLKKRIKTYLDN